MPISSAALPATKAKTTSSQIAVVTDAVTSFHFLGGASEKAANILSSHSIVEEPLGPPSPAILSESYRCFLNKQEIFSDKL